MRAAIFVGAGKPLEIQEVPDLVPAANQVLLEIGRCGICASDLHMTESHGGPTIPIGSRLGHEYSGRVIAIGNAVDRFKVGDHVAALAITGCGICPPCRAGIPSRCEDGWRSQRGGLAEFALVNECAGIALPNTLSVADGALIEPLAVGLHAARLARIEAGARILVIGPGSVGLNIAYWCRTLGAGRIAMLGRSRRNEELALALGANIFVSQGPECDKQIHEALGGPPDIVFECVGAPGLINQSVGFVRRGGTVLVVGLCTVPDDFKPATAQFKEVCVQFSFVYSTRDYEIVADKLDANAIISGMLISKTIGLDMLPDTFEALRKPNLEVKVQVDPRAGAC